MESVLYSMWSINIRNLVQNKFVICREFHIQPSEIDKMIYFEYEYLLEDIANYTKKQEADYKKQENQYKMPNPNSYKTPSFNMPKMNVPKI